MRRKIFAVLLVLTTLLCGCSRNAIESQTDSTESTAEITAETLESESSLFSSESNQTEAPKESTALETEKAQPTMPETLPDVPEQTVSQVQTAPSATESPAEETRKPVAPEKPQEIPKPAETEPQPAPEAPEETKPKSAYDFEFDMEAIKADCIDIGKGMGLHLDTSLTPSNATWWNPVTASQSNQGTKLKQDLESYIKFHTVENLGSYGIDEITDFNIYYEARGNGVYSVYFLFVSVLGQINIGLSSLEQRTYELLIRRAIGASRINIVALVLGTQLVISIFVCIVSILLSILIVEGIGIFLPPDTPVASPAYPFFSAVVAVVASVTVALLGGLLPALKAAKLEPALALR